MHVRAWSRMQVERLVAAMEEHGRAWVRVEEAMGGERTQVSTMQLRNLCCGHTWCSTTVPLIVTTAGGYLHGTRATSQSRKRHSCLQLLVWSLR